MRNIQQLRIYNKGLLEILVGISLWLKRTQERMFQKASRFLLLQLPNIQLFPQINILCTSKTQCWLLNCLTFSSLTTARFLDRRDFATHHVNPYNPVSLVSVYSYLDYLGEPADVTHTGARALSPREEAFTLSAPGLTEGPTLSPVLSGLKLGAEQ